MNIEVRKFMVKCYLFLVTPSIAEELFLALDSGITSGRFEDLIMGLWI